MAYEYFYENGEANFGPPMSKEVQGGAHLTFDVILCDGTKVWAMRRPDGLHDGPKDALYFPHGLIRFGETVDTAVARLAKAQGGARISRVEIYNLPSWVENDHWHLALNVFALLDGTPDGADGVSEFVQLGEGDSAREFAWWTQEQYDRMIAAMKTRFATNSDLLGVIP